MAGGEAQVDAGRHLTDAAPDLDQAQAQRLQPHPRRPRGDQPAAQGVEEAVRGPMQQQPELIGQEAMTGEPIAETAEFQILDPVLRLAAIGVPGVEGFRLVRPSGDHKAGVDALGQHLGLDDDSPLAAGSA